MLRCLISSASLHGLWQGVYQGQDPLYASWSKSPFSAMWAPSLSAQLLPAACNRNKIQKFTTIILELLQLQTFYAHAHARCSENTPGCSVHHFLTLKPCWAQIKKSRAQRLGCRWVLVSACRRFLWSGWGGNVSTAPLGPYQTLLLLSYICAFGVRIPVPDVD
jgi:hypothetical protein